MNPSIRKRLLEALLLSVMSASAHAYVVGRVIAATGDVRLERAGVSIPVGMDASVEDKDTVRTGGRSTTQVSFTDGSVMSLRENSELAIEDYRFDGTGSGIERAVFKLVKGGLRTVTGLIGRRARNDYAVRTVVATIGIRGTFYELMSCAAGSCRNADGSAARDGVYGAVHGRGSNVGVTTNAEYQFGAEETFFAAGANEAVVRLLGPVDFVARYELPPTRSQAGKSQDQAPQIARSQDATLTEISRTPSTLAGFFRTVAGQTALTPTGGAPTAPVNQGLATGLSPGPGSGALGQTISTSSSLSGAPQVAQTLIFAWAQNPSNIGIGILSEPFDSITFAGPKPVAFNSVLGPASFPAGALNAGSVVEAGSSATMDGGTLNWGRWTGAAVTVITTSNTPLNNPPTGVPFVYGDHTNVLPTSGVFMYNYAGGSNPVNTAGAVGSIISGGALTVTFGAVSGNFSIASPLQVAVGGFNYALNSCISGCTFGTATPHIVAAALLGTCSGGACSVSTPASAALNGHFVGPQGGGLATSVLMLTSGNLSPPVVFGTAYKR